MEIFYVVFFVVNLGLEVVVLVGYDFVKFWRLGLEVDDLVGFEGLGYIEYEGFDKRSYEEEEEEVMSWVL